MIGPLDLAAAARTGRTPYAAELPRTEPERPVAIDPAAVAADLGPSGPVARAMGQYEDRASQRAMARAVATLYNDGGIGFLEAGTGVGKSLGYLVPAIRWAAASGERTVVSTNTINLQEQLVRKDLPFLRDALAPHPVRFALLKGWRNYVCRLRLEQAALLGPSLVEQPAADAIARIRQWAATTRDGTLSDLPVLPPAEAWDEVAAEPDLCTRTACPHFADCFLFRARRAAAEADVVVVNHHLLMSDVAVRRAAGNWDDAAVLPPYDRLVVDEGHHLEDAAAVHLGSGTSRRALHRLLARLDRRGRGLVWSLLERLSAADDDLLMTATRDIVTERIVPSVRAAREKGELAFDLLASVLRESGGTVLRLGDDFSRHPVWRGGLHVALTDLLRELRALDEAFDLVADRVNAGERRDDTIPALVAELHGVARRMAGVGDALTAALRPPAVEAATVRWMELRGRDGNLAVHAAPLDLSDVFRDDVFGRVRTAIVTSATLAPDGRFDFVTRRLGAEASSAVTATFHSPFDYAAQSVLAVPTDLTPPHENATAHLDGVVRVIRDVVAASGGGVFALFTSHRDVRAAADALRRDGLGDRHAVLVHGEDGRDALLARFRAAGDAVLIGTASYWEGVDVPGRALRALVIARLPFRVPTDPVTAAHCEAIEARGGDAFAEYMLPHAALRLKQGFGRLIRNARDRGVIVIADPRLVSKRYGATLLHALPPARRVVAPWAMILNDLRRFYAAGHTPEEDA